MPSNEIGPDTGTLALINRIAPLTPSRLKALTIYVSQLIKWQQKTNLVAPSTLEKIWERHIADSLQCVAAFPEARVWADLGSGGGLPGLVTAIMVQDVPGSMVHLFESNQKKAAFLRSVSLQLGLDTQIHAGRIESEAKQVGEVEVVTARALAPLPKLLALAHPLMQGSVGLFHKGRDYAQEVEDCSGLWKFDLVKQASKIEPDSVLLEIRNLKQIQA